jgi:hypothetical protein
MSHETVAVSLPGMVTATTEKGGPGGTGIMEGVGDGDPLQDRHNQHSMHWYDFASTSPMP